MHSSYWLSSSGELDYYRVCSFFVNYFRIFSQIDVFTI